jgi:hypothetical protein
MIIKLRLCKGGPLLQPSLLFVKLCLLSLGLISKGGIDLGEHRGLNLVDNTRPVLSSTSRLGFHSSNDDTR